MATFRLPIFGGCIPDAQGDCWFEPMSVLGTNDQWRQMILRMGANNAAQPTLKAGVYGAFNVPKNYVGTPKIIVVWTATVTAGAVVFDFDYRAVGGTDTESLDQSGTQEAVTVTTSAAPSAAWERMENEMALTASNLAVDDIVEFYFARDGADASDAKAGSALVFDLLFQYADA